MQVIIDGHSGCCNGVRRAISAAEDYLDGHGSLYSLGSGLSDIRISRP